MKEVYALRFDDKVSNLAYSKLEKAQEVMREKANLMHDFKGHKDIQPHYYNTFCDYIDSHGLWHEITILFLEVQ